MSNKQKWPKCWHIAKGRLGGFRSHAFKFEDDTEFIQGLFKTKDTASLDFMEVFYDEQYSKNRDCEKDISSKFKMSLDSLDVIENNVFKKMDKKEEEE